MGVVAGLGWDALRTVERLEQCAEGVQRGEQSGEQAQEVQRLVQAGCPGLMGPLPDRNQHGILAPESGQGDYAGQPQGSDQEGGVSDGQEAAQPAEAANIDDVAHGVHHAARTQEK